MCTTHFSSVIYLSSFFKVGCHFLERMKEKSRRIQRRNYGFASGYSSFSYTIFNIFYLEFFIFRFYVSVLPSSISNFIVQSLEWERTSKESRNWALQVGHGRFYESHLKPIKIGTIFHKPKKICARLQISDDPLGPRGVLSTNKVWFKFQFYLFIFYG